MSIVPLNKLTLCGLKSEKAEVLKKLQILGSAHLIPFEQKMAGNEGGTQKETDKAIQALKYLLQCKNKRKQIKDKDNFNRQSIVQQVLDIQTEVRLLSDQRDFLINRIEEIKPWGDFNLATEAELGGIKLWFYIVPKRAMKLLDDDLIYQVVHVNNTHCFVVVLSEQEPAESSVPVARSHTGTIPLSKLKKDLQGIESTLEDKQAERESLTRWISLIHLSLIENEDNEVLNAADALCLIDQNLFAVQAWIAEKDKAQYQTFADNNGLVFMLESVTENDIPPTLLDNPKFLAGGEEVVKFYQTPAYRSWDPSIVLFFSFALFFAMILSDAGYALLLSVLLALKWKKLGNTIQGQRLRILALVTFLFSIVWGVLTGGYFGYSPPEHSFAETLKIMDINDFDSMMRLSISVGVVHIILANLIKAFQGKSYHAVIASLGWICLVTGGFTLWLISSQVMTQQPANLVAYSLISTGFVLLLFFASERIVRKPGDVFWKLVDGIKNITQLTKIFGDILSYMRLFALGLASASLALTFNQLAEQAYLSVPGLGLLYSLLILILGHTLNLMLCLMSGVVHGLRLNFIEFYNWSVSDEGYAFKAFAKKGGQ